MARSIIRFFVTIILLIAIWILLSGKFSPVYLSIGVFSAIGIALMVTPFGEIRRFPIVRFLLYLPWLTWQIILSDIAVAKIVLSPKMDIKPVFIRKKTKLINEKMLVLLGGSITLTPGTLTIDVTKDDVLVHALDKDVFAKDVENGVMEERIIRSLGAQVKEGDA